MYVKVKDLKYVRNDWVIEEYIKTSDNSKINSKLIRGLTSINTLKSEDHFEVIDILTLDEDNYSYLVLFKDNNCFITREDNVEVFEEPLDILMEYGYSRLIKSGDKTILLAPNGKKWITTKDKQDKDDPEKAIMILLLKSFGFNIEDIYELSKLI